tara:strand:- start:644 stop:1057 length:414 start_codon:yes stop_codon:yes gene_type:complete
MALKEQVGNVYSVGLNNVGSYQVSGIPWITGSTALVKDTEHTISFPYVARSVCVINHSSDTIRVHFNSKDAPGNVIGGLHFVELDSDEDSYTFNVKCKEIYISAPNNGSDREYRVVAELTNIPTQRMYTLTGSGLTD